MTTHPRPPAPGEPAQAAALVTGAAGFVGASVVAELLACGWAVTAVDDLSAGRPERLPLEHPALTFLEADAGQPGLLAERCAGSRATRLLHLAGPVGVRRVLADPDQAGARIADLGTAVERELLALPAPLRPRLFAASTSEVYAESSAPLGEDAALRAESDGRWRYAAAKLAGERHLSAALPDSVHLRLFNVVGPGQDADSGMVLPTFVERALAGEPLPVHGDGSSLRTYGHVQDVAADIVRLLELPAPPAGPLNLGGSARASAAELAELVATRAAHQTGQAPAPLEFVDPARSLANFAQVRRREPDLSRARALGLCRAPRSLQAIVDDTLARHGRQGLRAPAPCASPAS